MLSSFALGAGNGKGMFNQCNSSANGELAYYRYLVQTQDIRTIFDVGSRYDSEFLDFRGEVHYFEPCLPFLNQLKQVPNHNRVAHFNNFGLGNDTASLYYYPKYQSFYDRIASCGSSDDQNKIRLDIRKGDDYVKEKGISSIDFVKIDTEGFEFDVLKGLHDTLPHIKYIQFEYGGTFIDNNITLQQVIDYLKGNGFEKFSYLCENGTVLITDTRDHYQYCNIVCENGNM